MEEQIKHDDGILAKINNSKSINYNVLDKKTISDIFDKVIEDYKNKPREVVFYMGKLSYIMCCIIGETSIKAIQINKLFKWYNLYNRLLTLSDLKAHHISVGYSKISSEDYAKHRRLLISKKDIFENKIYELWEQRKM